MLPLDPDPMLPRVRLALRGRYGAIGAGRRLPPVDQLVRSEIGGRTLDAVSWPAFEALKARYPNWRRLAVADPAEVEAVIAPVTWAEAKARWLVTALRTLIEWRGAPTLDFLEPLPLETAFRKLKNLTGVGSKVASSVLNFSTFARPILVVDTHLARVGYRLGLASSGKDLDRAHRELMRLTEAAWDAEDLYELHRLVKMFGQEVCTHDQPACHVCPFAGECPSARVVH
ncbi:hypothetical protein CSW64_14695 [Caulobacter mirabilis]|uniref:HhH-GPD domain-containing protein n=2 Tax=Caulobacter mirabilis TaxID=69666 RepID=A0A2D2AZZ6_9CAUL|nr:hypothetical protein CSW64_14695 [Caulobacter mirabilis]